MSITLFNIPVVLDAELPRGEIRMSPFTYADILRKAEKVTLEAHHPDPAAAPEPPVAPI